MGKRQNVDNDIRETRVTKMHEMGILTALQMRESDGQISIMPIN